MKEHLSSKHKLYILLLLCSNLNCFKDIASELAVDFETLSFYSLKSFLPPKAIIKVFGKKSLYKGNAKTKISKLAEELNISRSTVSRYLEQAEKMGYIKRDDKGIHLRDKKMFIITSETIFAIIKNYYPEILTDEDLRDRCVHN